jgi:hypothetical protein
MNVQTLQQANVLINNLNLIEERIGKINGFAELANQQKVSFKMSFKQEGKEQLPDFCGDLDAIGRSFGLPPGVAMINQKDMHDFLIHGKPLPKFKQGGKINIKKEEELENQLKIDSSDILVFRVLEVIKLKLVEDRKEILKQLRKLKVKI